MSDLSKIPRDTDPSRVLNALVGVPAHVHHRAFLMNDPPNESRRARAAFEDLLATLRIPPDQMLLSDRWGYGLLRHGSGDRLIIRWQLHTEFFSYQTWHVPADPMRRLEFGPLEWPGMSVAPDEFGPCVTDVDLLICNDPVPASSDLGVSAEASWYGSRVLGSSIRIVTDFQTDAGGRRRYLIRGPDREVLQRSVVFAVECVTKLENYYHLILLPLPEFVRAMEEVYLLEKRQLADRDAITAGLSAADPKQLETWLVQLTGVLADVSRLEETIRYNLASAVPYDSIIRTTVEDLRERPWEHLTPLGEYIIRKTRGIADGYQRLINRIDALQESFEGMVAILRTRVDLAMEQQSLMLLSRVDRTTKIQLRLSQMVESLSVVVQAYYVTGLANYGFKALEHYRILSDASTATALFVPVAVVISLGLTWQAKRLLIGNEDQPTKKAPHDSRR